MLARINGILFPGGGTEIFIDLNKNNNTFTSNAAYIVN